jgi:hypothetical protein
MRVRVHQAGDDDLAADVEDLGAVGDLDVRGRSDGNDLAVVDHQDAVFQRSARDRVDAGTAEDDRPAGGRRVGGSQRSEEDQGEGNEG